MTDQRLAVALLEATALEREAREYLRQQVDSGDLQERNLALGVVRQVAGLRQACQEWIAARAVRAHAHQ